MSEYRLKKGLVFSLLLVLSILVTGWFFCIDGCRANEPILASTNSEMLKQARSLQKQGELAPALALFEQLADNGNPDAMFYAGKSLSRGWGTKPDLVKAEHYLAAAVRHEFSRRGEAAYELGRLFQRSIGPDCNTLAVEWFEKSIKWKYAKASLQLAIHYEKGMGVDQNISKAIKNFEIAAHAGYEQALLKYAAILLDGRYGIRQNPQRAELMVAKAMTRLEHKARAGSASAAKQLGRIYHKGQLIEVDLEKAEKWLLKSARSGSTGGMHDIARLMLKNTGDPERQSEAIDWLRAAAERGHGGAMTTLGRLHLQEKYGLPQAQAVAWFERGVEAGHGGAMEELAKLFQQGLLVPQNITEAIRLAQLGSDHGHAGSARLLAQLIAEQV